ncbi:MAG: hypothetical protein P8144_08915 [Gammaproteobacteria bacterium]
MMHLDKKSLYNKTIRPNSSKGSSCRKGILGLTIVTALAGALPTAYGDQSNRTAPAIKPWKISWGWHYFEGDYRLTESTRVFYVPWKIQYQVNRSWQVALTTPWLAVFGPGTASDTTIFKTPNQTISEDATGLGDVILSAAYLSSKQWLPGWWHGISVKQKIPTADAEKRLGSGEPDTSFHVTFFKTTDHWQWLIETAYKKRSDATLDNSFSGSLGALYMPATSIPLRFGIISTIREPATPSRSMIQEWTFYTQYHINTAWSISSYLSTGTTADSLDFGFGAQVDYRF